MTYLNMILHNQTSQMNVKSVNLKLPVREDARKINCCWPVPDLENLLYVIYIKKLFQD